MSFSDSVTAFETNFENFVVETETDVQALIAAIQKGVAFTETQLADGISWVASKEPTIAPILEEALSFAAGLSAGPTASLIITGAQDAIAALQSVASSNAAGASTVQTLLNGYAAVKTAQAAAASATAAATKTVVPAAA